MKKQILPKILLISVIILLSAQVYATGCLVFDGTDDYVAAPHHAVLNVSAVTIEMRFFWSASVSNRVDFLIAKGFEELEIHTGGASGHYGLRFIPTESVWLDTEPYAFTPDSWHHVAFIYDPAQGLARCYIDGAEHALTNNGTSGLNTAITSSSDPLLLGRRSGDQFYFEGKLDEVRIWNTVRSAAQITENIGKELNGDESGLIAYYNMNEESGSTLNDVSPTENHATIYGASRAVSDWTAFSGGCGTSSDPYHIATLEDLRKLSENTGYQDRYFIQTADIDASATSTWNGGEGFIPIGPGWSARFTGYYDGQGYSISNLYINRPEQDHIGLFGLIYGGMGAGERIRDIHLRNVQITGDEYVGGIAGTHYDSGISACSVRGTVSGTRYVGGCTGYTSGATISELQTDVSVIASHDYAGGICGNIAGRIEYSLSTGDTRTNALSSGQAGGISGGVSQQGSIYYSFASGATHAVFPGGLAGHSMGRIEDCYAAGPISGSYSGGLVSQNYGTVVNSYANNTSSAGNSGGLIGENYTVYPDLFEVNNCFWNSDSTLSEVARGSAHGSNYGKTTAEMKSEATFTAVGWDFNTVWAIDPEINNGFPHLLMNTPPPPDVPLAISLSAFTVEISGGIVIVTWVTESETENAAFRIYRNDEMLDELEGAGTTSEQRSYRWTDNYVIPGRNYTYVLADVDLRGKETKHPEIKVEVEVKGVDLDYTIGKAYPNPFNPQTMVPLNLAKDAMVKAALYDIGGRKLRDLHKGSLCAGSHALKIDAANLSTGIYFVHVRINDETHVQKIALIK
jgi:hypothetical protein